MEKATQQSAETSLFVSSSIRKMEIDFSNRLDATELAMTQATTSVQSTLEGLVSSSISRDRADIMQNQLCQTPQQIQSTTNLGAPEGFGIIGEIHDENPTSADHASPSPQDTNNSESGPLFITSFQTTELAC